jgi:hypothetical protein
VAQLNHLLTDLRGINRAAQLDYLMTDMHGVIQSAQVDDVIVIGMHNII